MGRGSAASLLPVLLFVLCVTSASSYYDQRKVYIVYLGEHQRAKTVEEIHGDHHSFLLSVKDSEAQARESLLYSYKNSINGFAALLSPDEAARLSEMEGVITTFPSEPTRWSMHTTRSWEFLGQEEGLTGDEKERMPSRANYGKDITVGLLDSGLC
ncbi:hypothetical protein Taro_005253 [Colocasia esculenta]|uniref:Inhibitor I9 domain-containing protein n=1 Tax=Colocasia esculenta TaxID=4460 RepID=A0A843TSJ2_COLES|nr:hypothetical protein [Colocasia esculenta]